MSRTRKAQQTETNKLLKELNRRLNDLDDTVQKARDFSECALELDETVAQQASVNKSRMEALKKEFHDNKIRAINTAASELGKVVITEEELQELRDELDRVKEMGRQEVASSVEKLEKQYNEKLEQSMNIQKLTHEAESARLRADAESHKKEVENLNAALARMAEELKSQKELTASVVARQHLPANHSPSV